MKFEVIRLGKKFTVTIDKEDWDTVRKYKWRIHKDSHTFYVCSVPDEIKLHRLLLGETDPLILVDHKDLNGLNNRKTNLRRCTRTQNAHNRRKTRGTSRYKGVHYAIDRDKWRAKIVVAGDTIHLGYFSTELEAALAYDERALTEFGEFAKTNKELALLN